MFQTIENKMKHQQKLNNPLHTLSISLFKIFYMINKMQLSHKDHYTNSFLSLVSSLNFIFFGKLWTLIQPHRIFNNIGSLNQGSCLQKSEIVHHFNFKFLNNIPCLFHLTSQHRWSPVLSKKCYNNIPINIIYMKL